MKICIIAQVEPSQHKGGGKAQYSLGREWSEQGHSVTLIGADQLAFKGASKAPPRNPLSTRRLKREAVKRFVKENGNKYDIIDVDYNYLPDFQVDMPNTLLVGRSVLFKTNKLKLLPPEPLKLKTRVKRFIESYLLRTRETQKKSLSRCRRCIAHADLLNVTSELDIEAAISLGAPASRICRFPYALDQGILQKLSHTQAPSPSDTLQLVFLGTFDYRKGCLDLVLCFRKLRRQIPTLKLTLIGAKGLHQTEKEIRAFFNAEENQNLSIHMTFQPDSLDKMLASKHAAIFPSYYEGFPFSVQETLAAGIPTIAYDTPGAHDLLPKDWLVPAGDVEDMCKKLSKLIVDSNNSLRLKSQSIVQQYNWQTISRETLKCYEAHLAQKRSTDEAAKPQPD